MIALRKLGTWSFAALTAAALVVACGSGSSTTSGFLDAGVDGSPDSTADGTTKEGGGGGRHDGSLGHKDAARMDGHVVGADARGEDGRGVDAVADSPGQESGVDSGPKCLPPQVDCTSACANLANDPANCGSCGHACPAGLLCSSSTCTANCAPNQVECTADGGVITVIDAGATPDAGDASTVDAQANPVGAYCAETDNDRLNCGGCGIVCPHGPNSTPVCSDSKCSLACAAGFGDCDSNLSNGCETNINTNPMSCGACGLVCDIVNASAACTSGSCGIGMCTPGYADCDGKPQNGCEIDIDTISNCGGCGDTCTLANASAGCPSGKCTITSCDPGFADCDHTASTGCEINVNGDTSNCGGCGARCTEPNASPVCTGGQCAIASCDIGFRDCNMVAADGCEVSLATDPNNCGGCGNVCALPHALAACSSGVCAVGECEDGWADCNMNPIDGCEVNIGADPANCGACTHQCNLAEAMSSCTGGLCSIAACNPGFTDCDHVASNGCEIDTQTDPMNCGLCNRQCAVFDGTPGCNAGSCDIRSCNTNHADCDGVVANGCEVDTATDDNNCGACGNACNTTCGGAVDHVTATSCNSSVCGITGCANNFVDFDGKCADGCECAASETQSACANAASLFSGTLQPGNSITAFTSTMAPASVTDAWFTLTFGGNGSINFHPKINLASTNNEFIMDVNTNCAGGTLTTCTDNGANHSHGVLTWETNYSGQTPPGDPNSKNPAGVSNFAAIPLPGDNGQVWIHVYRKAGATKTCNAYTITAAD